MIFRLGYEPETIELGGSRWRASASWRSASFRARGLRPPAGAGGRRGGQGGRVDARPRSRGASCAFEVAPAQVIRPISPYVYGINSQKAEAAGTTVRRMGGNRQTAYNWEINASSAGSDYRPLERRLALHGARLRRLRRSRVPQFLDFATATGARGWSRSPRSRSSTSSRRTRAGAVPEKEKAPEQALEQLATRRSRPFTTSPDLSDGAVYEDEFVNCWSQARQGRQGRDPVLLARQRAGALAVDAPAGPPGEDDLRGDGRAHRGDGGEITRLDPGAVVLGGVDVRLVGVHVAVGCARRQGEQRQVR